MFAVVSSQSSPSGVPGPSSSRCLSSSMGRHAAADNAAIAGLEKAKALPGADVSTGHAQKVWRLSLGSFLQTYISESLCFFGDQIGTANGPEAQPERAYKARKENPRMSVVSTIKTTDTSRFAVFAAGCFWGVEYNYRKYFQFPSQILDIKVGYANGRENIANPSYKQVCTGETDFAEAVLISYEPSQTSYKDLVDFFFRIHDPTTLNSQGPDMGTQYRSGIFTTDDEQKKIAEAVKDTFQKEWYKNKRIVTEIEDFRSFYDAETYHQLYLNKHTERTTCETHFYREKPE